MDAILEIHWRIGDGDSIDTWDDDEINEDDTIGDYISSKIKRDKLDVLEEEPFYHVSYQGEVGVKFAFPETRIGDIPVITRRRNGRNVKVRWINIGIMQKEKRFVYRVTVNDGHDWSKDEWIGTCSTIKKAREFVDRHVNGREGYHEIKRNERALQSGSVIEVQLQGEKLTVGWLDTKYFIDPIVLDEYKGWKVE